MWQFADTLTRCDRGTVSRITSSKWRAHRYVPILFIHSGQILKNLSSNLSSTRSTPTAMPLDSGKATVDAGRWSRGPGPGTHSSRVQPAVRVRHRSLAKWSAITRVRSEDESQGRGPALLLSPSVSGTRVSTDYDDLRGSHGATPPIIAAAALLTHGNRLYRRVYLVYRDEDRGSRSRRIGFSAGN